MTLDITIAPPDTGPSGTRRQIATYTGPASYATGGDTVDAKNVRMGLVWAILGLSISNGTAVLHGWYNVATGKIMWFVAAGTQVTNTTDLSTYSGRVEFVGR